MSFRPVRRITGTDPFALPVRSLLSERCDLATITMMVEVSLPPGVIERIVEVLEPDEVWLFGSRARQTHGPDSDWDMMAILPDSASEDKLDLVNVWGQLRELRRMRVEVFPIRRSDFDEVRHTPGELAEAVAREGRIVYDR
jgi:predicted nucleotidyltransferase